ncbi:MAG: sigma-70 family RNA polymerase sigma factor, partial [Abitibacteriaceae bacterium]|nr:sigma-70 family RNA polymerase sigma factor [Abditibacteriaceae bacterium]
MQDWQLLREYVDQGSQAAFAILVERYINLVYSTCLREVRNPSLAEDATQVVFLILAKKAHTLREGSVLAGWLFQTARFAAKDALKQESRRQRHERNAAHEMITQAPAKTISWGSLEPHLHEALAGLRQHEREAVLLRFLHDKSLKEVAISLGISEEAARKRVTRALDKMRRYFSQHGFAVTGVVLATLMAEH